MTTNINNDNSNTNDLNTNDNSDVTANSANDNQAVLLTNDDAMQISENIIGNKIVKAIPFLYDNKNYIVAMQDYNDDQSVYYDHIYLLEPDGNNDYSIAWKKDLYNIYGIGLNYFSVNDADNDGYDDIEYYNLSAGSGMKTDMFYVYSIKNDTEYEVDINTTYGINAGSEQTTKVSDNLNDPNNQDILSYMNNRISSTGIVEKQPSTSEINSNPRWAAKKFLQDNGNITNGILKLYWYPGAPVITKEGKIITATPLISIDNGNYTYEAYFKSALFMIDKTNNKFCVLYIPEDNYNNWFNSIKLEGDNLNIDNRIYINTKTYEIQTNSNQ